MCKRHDLETQPTLPYRITTQHEGHYCGVHLFLVSSLTAASDVRCEEKLESLHLADLLELVKNQSFNWTEQWTVARIQQNGQV